ncbi:hypothetical protein A3D77_04160 [Candidatus Gottesmanbacteria bacterium RIFCSPHIGHO2_02_FULL_39_11]|uniref:Acyltransferase 3 domain-containing protein n=1 Tax=Candidatus Gottesmanbacteria bacterium RIFCSPHIGHO2_02_FULL_39_11 TaxID=1798382 RepID=A0A1F5ZK00_9BACT|nr:MAG: hypothetical protein A3D77_04160 [Candidatus Gottesmanbacteria bacterium RIFCSPHIGHO2_02_FULL_39_11]
MKKRHYAVDGLKGLAIIAVIFTHIPLRVWYGSVPGYLHSLLDIILGSGGIGVTIFFILTGFLMGRLYELPSSSLSFWRRRYARLFPPFLVMVASFTIFHLIPGLAPIFQVFIFLVCAFGMWAVWKVFFKIASKKQWGKWIMAAILGSQICIIILYTGFLLQVPSSIFYQVWPPVLRILVTAIVNATLTLPFGQYVDQLDGIYWALEAELLFYILYPIWVAPLVYYSKRLSSVWKVLGIASLLPFCFGLYLITQRILGFEMVKMYLIIYFIGGVIIGANHTSFKNKLIYLKPIIVYPLWFFFLLFAVFLSVKLTSLFPLYYRPWLPILTVFPISLLLLSIEDESSYGNKFFRFPLFIFLGKHSYALFLVHSFVIHTVSRFVSADTALNGVILAIFSFMGSITFALILYQLTERPYFLFREKSKQTEVKKEESNLYSQKYAILSFRVGVISLLITILVLLYTANKPPVSLFTLSSRHGGNPVWLGLNEKDTVLITDQPTRQLFVASENNLGMIMMHIRNQEVPGVRGGFVPFKLNIRLKNENNGLISESSYNAYEIIDSRYHPFGFPIQINSKGKHYSLEYQLSEKSPSQIVQLVTNEANLLSVYFVDKKSLLKNPQLSAIWALEKLKEPFTNLLYWLSLIYISPFLFYIVGTGIVLIKNKKI